MTFLHYRAIKYELRFSVHYILFLFVEKKKNTIQKRHIVARCHQIKIKNEITYMLLSVALPAVLLCIKLISMTQIFSLVPTPTSPEKGMRSGV